MTGGFGQAKLKTERFNTGANGTLAHNDNKVGIERRFYHCACATFQNDNVAGIDMRFYHCACATFQNDSVVGIENEILSLRLRYVPE